ncbi:hypothetical protein [Lentilactobacillus hilgardii]|uniref:hypothetical protein n=1 Tax=Lentilactobacillus hilgardii TaxID=1588 RepID=UPI0021A64BDF|nr:hypothetical protein [Lentilactobacillus hilgardii]MCT3397708.1 hypothetical protein [Lentilactobacillus hilgardii]
MNINDKLSDLSNSLFELKSLYEKDSDEFSETREIKEVYDLLICTIRSLIEKGFTDFVNFDETRTFVVEHSDFKLEIRVENDRILFLIYPKFVVEFASYYDFCQNQKNNAYFISSLKLNSDKTDYKNLKIDKETLSNVKFLKTEDKVGMNKFVNSLITALTNPNRQIDPKGNALYFEMIATCVELLKKLYNYKLPFSDPQLEGTNINYLILKEEYGNYLKS